MPEQRDATPLDAVTSPALTIPATDPAPRPDGRCVLCRKPRKITREAKRYAGHWLDLDPFCSRSCAEAFHDVDPRANEEAT